MQKIKGQIDGYSLSLTIVIYKALIRYKFQLKIFIDIQSKVIMILIIKKDLNKMKMVLNVSALIISHNL